MRNVRTTLSALVMLLLTACTSQADAQTYRSFAVGTMTSGSWHEAIRPTRLEFPGSSFFAAAIGVERPLGRTPLRYGVEVQFAAHVGRQDHLELSVPVTLRYVPRQGTIFRSFAAGLGLSYATKPPQVEIDRNGASQRLFVHWIAEIELATPAPDQSLFFRLHHRSDGYGIFEVDAGSTALVLGWRKRF